MRYLAARIGPEFDGRSLYEFWREGHGLSDGCIRRAKRRPGGLRLEGKPSWVRATVHNGYLAEIAIDDEIPSVATPETGTFGLLYEDDDLIVVDKPAGRAMYPCPGHDDGTLLNLVAGHLARSGKLAGLHAAHRLDVGTSGLAVFATSAFAKERLQRQLLEGAFHRSYLAICEGELLDERAVDAPIGRVPDKSRSFDVVHDGKHARTRIRPLAALDGKRYNPAASRLSLVEVELETGRTHQVRIHMAHVGHPLLGDTAYGRPSPLIARPALHSWKARLKHPLSGETLELEAPIPEDFRLLLPSGIIHAPA